MKYLHACCNLLSLCMAMLVPKKLEVSCRLLCRKPAAA